MAVPIVATDMGESGVRGTRLGATSYERETAHIEFADRMRVHFMCPRGHTFDVVFAQEADVPATWECVKCGAMAAHNVDEIPVVEERARTGRQPWDMLIERRTIADLEALLAERMREVRMMNEKKPA